MFIVFSINGDSHTYLEKIKSMFEEALLRHPEHTLENPAEIFYNNFEILRPFHTALKERYMSERCYYNENDFKKRDFKAFFLWHRLRNASELIIGEIISEHEDTIFNEKYGKRFILGKEFIIRVNKVLLGDINEGETIKARSPGGKFLIIRPNYEDYPYMSGDTVLVFLRHFPSKRCGEIMNDHKNEVGYKMPFYEVLSGGMFWVTSLDFKADSLKNEVDLIPSPLRITYHEKLYLWNEPFDYTYSEVKETLSKFIGWGKEWQKRWYNYVDPELMDYIVLKQFNSERAINSIIWR